MIRKLGAALILFLVCCTAAVALSTYNGFTNRSSGYVVTDTDWNGEFGNFISHYNTNAIGTFNLLLGKGRILSSDGTNISALTNAGAGDNGKVLTLDNGESLGVKWSSPGGTGLTTTGDILYYSGGNTRLPIGSTGQVLTVAGGVPTWATSSSAFETGMIMMWGGSLGSIPSGWHLCDGTSGTVNLQGLFIVGAGNISPAATGGLGNLSIGATGGATTHTHSFTSNTHTHTFADETNLPSTIVSGLAGGGSGQASSTSHTHDVSGTTSATAVTGTTGSTANSPPYYALAFIQKI